MRRLYVARELHGVGQTQQQVADKLGVSRRTVSNDLNRNLPKEGEPPTITNSRGQKRLANALESVTERFTGAYTALSRP